MFNRPQNPDMEALGFDPLMRRGPYLEDTAGQITQTQSAFRDKSIQAVKIDGLPPSTVTIEAEGVVVGDEEAINFIAGTDIAIAVTDDPTDGRVNVEISSTSSGAIGAFAFVTEYAALARSSTTLTSIGAVTFDNFGANVSANYGTGEAILNTRAGPVYAFAGNPSCSTSIQSVTSASGTVKTIYLGLGNLVDGATPNVADYTAAHVGFKIVPTADNAFSLYGTQADGATEAVTAALTTFTNSDFLDLTFTLTSDTSTDFHWRKNGVGAGPTTLTGHMPPSSLAQSATLCVGVFNNGA